MGQEPPPGSYFFVYVANFANIAAGAAQTRAIRVDGGVDFTCDQLQAGIYEDALNGAAIPGTPFYRRQDIESVAATGPTLTGLGSITLDIRQNDRPWFDQPVRMDLITGDALDPFWFGVKPEVPGNETVQITLQNNSLRIVDGQVVLVGYKTRVRR